MSNIAISTSTEPTDVCTPRLALATCTLVVQHARDHGNTDDEVSKARFERAIDATVGLRRLSAAELRQAEHLLELRCSVEVGPIRWTSELGLQRQIQPKLDQIAGTVGGKQADLASAVFNITRVELSAEHVSTIVTDLTTRADDLWTPLATRKQLSEEAARLRRLSLESTSRSSSPTGRKCLDWDGDPQLQVLKMLAWTVREHERASVNRLWTRVGDLCEAVMQTVLGEPGVTFAAVRERIAQKQGTEITPSKLMQRADKAERYGELNGYADAVKVAYQEIVTPSVNVLSGDRRLH